MTFIFPDFETLRLAVTGGAVPVAVSLASARSGLDADGRPWVTPAQPASRTLQTALRRLGVRSQPDEPAGGNVVAHWPQVFPLRRDSVPPANTEQTPVLFELTNATELATLVGEMLRLGNDRQGYRWLREGVNGECRTTGEDRSSSTSSLHTPGSTVLLRVVGPPYYSLLRALDVGGPDTVRAYVERAPRVWVTLGYSHPLGDLLRAPEGQLVLIHPPAEWRYIDEAPFRDIYDVVEFALPGSVKNWRDSPPAGKLNVPLRLATVPATEPAELWVLNGDGPGQIDALVRDADDALLARLAFAVGDLGDRRVAVLRARPGKEGPPVLILDSLDCRSYLRLPNLFVPLSNRLRPPLRRDAVRTLLADDPGRINWLVPHDDGSFTAQSLPDEAFRPLTDWVQYIFDTDGERLDAWVQATGFDFAPFVGRDEVVPAKASQARDRRPRGGRATDEDEERPAVRSVAAAERITKKDAGPPPTVEAFTPTAAAPPSEVQQRLKESEQRFLAVDGPLDAPARRTLWPDLARLNTELGQTTDAAACWLNALWEPAEPPPAWAWGWVRAEKALVQPDLSVSDLDRLTADPRPSAPDLRPLAAAVIWAAAQDPVPPALRQRLPAVQGYLEKHSHLLPVRAAWLTAVGLTRLAGSDVLALTRTRDRLLERLLTEGLSPERDLPGFLRFAGQRDADRLRVVRERAERLRHLAHAWFADSVSQVGRYDQTPAYIDLMFAFGLARLHETSACQVLLRSATSALENTEGETHTVLLQAFRYRIEQVLSGRPHSGALPADLIEYVDHLRVEYEKQTAADDDPNRWVAYIVDRLREQSRILEPHERFHPYRYTSKSQGDQLSKELAEWPDIKLPRHLRTRIEGLLGPGVKNPPTGLGRVQVLAQAISLAPRVGEDFCLSLIRQVPAAVDAVTDRGSIDPYALKEAATLLERAILFAAHFDDRAIVPIVMARLVKLLDTSAGPTALEATASLVGQTLRSLRKFGMRDEAERLLARVGQWAFRGQSLDRLKAQDTRGWPQVLEMLLRLAAGWLDFDRAGQAQPILEEARAYLLRGATGLTGADQVRYVSIECEYIFALGHGSVEAGLDRVEELLSSGRTGTLVNTYTSSSHYSRFHLNIVEAVVLALASEEFALGPAARRWLDDDEYLVRRRIHADVRTAINQAGL